ncbi:hypothetical protein Scep_020857 [Stephania cephalantha]|uniref:Uncharacterized protein n=1 Tax=Stephania cephalantha TaxID=152367 RepID=A0AAP0F7G3_9MAGN
MENLYGEKTLFVSFPVEYLCGDFCGEFVKNHRIQSKELERTQHTERISGQ